MFMYAANANHIISRQWSEKEKKVTSSIWCRNPVQTEANFIPSKNSMSFFRFCWSHLEYPNQAYFHYARIQWLLWGRMSEHTEQFKCWYTRYTNNAEKTCFVLVDSMRFGDTICLAFQRIDFFRFHSVRFGFFFSVKNPLIWVKFNLIFFYFAGVRWWPSPVLLYCTYSTSKSNEITQNPLQDVSAFRVVFDVRIICCMYFICVFYELNKNLNWMKVSISTFQRTCHVFYLVFKRKLFSKRKISFTFYF